jgi:Mg-chelatase subunit ChlD
MENKSIDLLSKLMANENITVLRQKVQTASFDLKSRTLRLPTLVGMTPAEETVMEFHEVGHALFTGEEYITLVKKQEKKNFSSYMNVLEDVRIERLMKQQYPGCRKDFFAGYKVLNERDFFGTANRDLNEYGIIDRINLHFKVGFSCGVKFTKEERVFLTAAENAETVEDVYDLALRIYDYAADEKNKKQEEQGNDIEFGEGDSDEFGDEEYDFDFDDDMVEEEDAEDADLPPMDDGVNEEKDEEEADDEDTAPAPQTQDRFNEKVQANTNVNGWDFIYIQPKNYYEPKFIGYKDIVAEFRAADFGGIEMSSYRKEQYTKFRAANQKSVSHLVKEFEMRKAAQRYSRTQVAQTGSLSMSKLHQYKTSEDLFRKLDVITDDKNHSFLMLLDWSGSMQNYLQDSLGQVITLASFCRRVNIPFQVCAFSDSRNADITYTEEKFFAKYNDAVNEPGQFGVINGDMINILNFLDSKMSNSEFDFVCEMLYTFRFMSISDSTLQYKYRLGGTPLIESIAWLYDYIDEFKKNTKAEKMTVITVTDGEGQGVSYKTTDATYTMKRMLRCPKTGRVYTCNHRTETQANMMDMIKYANPDVRFIGFFIAGSIKNVRSFNYQNNNKVFDVSGVMRQLNKDYFYEYPSAGYHKMYIIPSQTGNMEFNTHGIDKDMSAARIAKSFSSSMSSVIKSRVVLTKFISEIA